MMHIKKTWVIQEVQLVKQAQDELDYLKLMRKQKFEYPKPSRKIYKNSKYGVEVRQ